MRNELKYKIRNPYNNYDDLSIQFRAGNKNFKTKAKKEKNKILVKIKFEDGK